MMKRTLPVVICACLLSFTLFPIGQAAWTPNPVEAVRAQADGRASIEATPGPSLPSSRQRSLVILRAGHADVPFRVLPPAQLSQWGPQGVQGATITVNYIVSGTKNVFNDTCLTWPAGSQAAFNYAVSIWASLIKSSVPIKINACWASLNPGTLGHGAAESYHRDFSGAPQVNTWYAAALANARAGSDLNDLDSFDDDGDGLDADADIETAYNGTGINWYFGTDGRPAMSEYDLVSVVLHEIAHGLDFSGSMRVAGGLGSWGRYGTSDPAPYDRFTENGSGQALLSFPNNSAALAAQLISDTLRFNGANATAANGGSKPRLYAPNPWEPGSSYSHLHTSFDGTANALMTPVLNNGEAVHSPGPVAMGILKDIGWPDAADVRIIKQIVGSQYPSPGSSITFTLAFANIGSVVATGVVITDIIPPQVRTPTFVSSRTITRTGVLTYVWSVGTLGIGQSGVITISGKLSSTLPSKYAVVNTAVIWAAQDDVLGNNTSTVILGGYRTYLPTVLR